MNSTSDLFGPSSRDPRQTTPTAEQLLQALRSSRPNLSSPEAAGEDPPLEVPRDEIQAAASRERPTRRTMRRAIRSLASRAARFTLPITRPLARRTRSYLTKPLRDDLHERLDQQSDRLRAQVADDVNHVHFLLSQQNMAILARLDSRDGAASVIQELQWQVLALQNSIRDMIVERDRTPQLERDLDIVKTYALIGARRAVVPIGTDTLMVRTAVGFVMCSAFDLGALATLVDTGDLEPGTRKFIESVLRPGDTFVDVGANLGLHTLAAARTVGPTGRVVSFEPFEQTATLLQSTIAINGIADRTTVHVAAVGATSCTRELFVGVNSGHHSLHRLESHLASPVGSVPVPTVRLDDVIVEARVDVVKIDVEGAELEVIKGAERVLTEHPEIGMIVEFGPVHLTRTGEQPEAWLKSFTSLGLRWQVIDEHTGALRTMTLAELLTVESVNLFFAAPDSKLWLRLQ